MVVVAGIDCGSNSTRLLVSEVNNGEIKKLFKRKKFHYQKIIYKPKFILKKIERQKH